MRSMFFGLCCLWGVLVSGVAMGDVAFNTFGAGDSFASNGYVIGPSHDGFEFVSAISGTLESVDVAALFITDGGADLMQFSLWSDGGTTPGSELWTGTVDPVGPYSILSMSAGSSAPTLSAGSEYWISARSMNGLDTYSWAANDQSISGSGVVDAAGGTNWTTFSGDMTAFRINVNAIPEPSSTLALIGWSAFALSRRRRV